MSVSVARRTPTAMTWACAASRIGSSLMTNATLLRRQSGVGVQDSIRQEASMPTEPTHQTVRLSRGKHSSPAQGVCVMELASMLAGESFNDRPACVDPVIGGLLRAYNDNVDGERRQDL